MTFKRILLWTLTHAVAGVVGLVAASVYSEYVLERAMTFPEPIRNLGRESLAVGIKLRDANCEEAGEILTRYVQFLDPGANMFDDERLLVSHPV